MALKGISRRAARFSLGIFNKTLELNTTMSATHRQIGYFRPNGAGLQTYSQCKTAISAVYAKRIVAEDGVSTSPLNI